MTNEKPKWQKARLTRELGNNASDFPLPHGYIFWVEVAHPRAFVGNTADGHAGRCADGLRTNIHDGDGVKYILSKQVIELLADFSFEDVPLQLLSEAWA